MSTRAAGALLALLSAVCFGLVPLLGRVAYDGGADAATALLVRFAVAGAVLLAVARAVGEPWPARRAVGALLLLGGVGYGLQSLAYFSALERLSPGLTSLLLYAYPAVVVLLTALVHRRAPSPLAAGAVLVATLGVALSVGPVEGGLGLGVALGLAAAAAYALLYVVSPPLLRRAGPLTGAGLVCAATAAFDAAVVGVQGPQWPSGAGAWSALVAVGLVGGAVAVTAFFAALTRLAPPEVAVLSTVEPVVALAGAALLLGEPLRGLQVLGGALVLVAVVVLARTGARRDLEVEVEA